MALALSTASNKYLFSKEDLDKYPQSVLSILLASTGGSNSELQGPRCLDRSTGLVLDVNNVELPMSKFPNITKDEAVSLIYGVYKHGYLPVDSLEALTSKPTFGSSDSQVHENLHAELSNLLDYFNLTGPVTRWLPPVKTLSLSHSPLIALSYTCCSLELVKAAAVRMLSYKPHARMNMPLHTAIFLVQGTKLDTPPLAGSTVYVVPSPPEFLTSQIIQAGPYYGVKDSGWRFKTTAYVLPEGGDDGRPLHEDSVWNICQRDHVISSNSELGGYLLAALQALKPAKMRVYHGSVADTAGAVHVWLLQW